MQNGGVGQKTPTLHTNTCTFDAERKRAKYELEHLVRVHLGADEPAYRCIFQEPDSRGQMGVALSKDIVKVAAKALTTNLTRLGTLLVR